MKIIIAILLPLLLLGSKCKNEPPEPTCKTHYDTTTLPPVTACGANNFGCLVNGEVWVPEINPPVNSLKRVHAEYSGSLLLSAGRFINNGQTDQIIKIVLKSVYSTGKYTLGNQSDSTFAVWTDNHGCRIYSSDIQNGIVEITTFDRENFIIAGTFEFTLVKDGCDTIRVTNGSFDVRE